MNEGHLQYDLWQSGFESMTSRSLFDNFTTLGIANYFSCLLTYSSAFRVKVQIVAAEHAQFGLQLSKKKKRH